MTTANLTRAEARSRTAALTVDTYDVTLDVTGAEEPGNAWFDTTTTITFTSSAPTTLLDFLDGQVQRVVVNGADLPSAAYDGARVALGELSTEAINTVTVVGRGRYSTSGQGLHRFTDLADGNTYLYTQYEPSDSRRVYAQFDQPDLKAHHTFHIAAPEGWLVWSNQPEVATGPGPVEGTSWHHFAPTPPLSTYLSAVMAGPYHRVSDQWTSEDGSLTVDLGLACRPDRAKHLDAEVLFDLTKRGLEFFNREFGYPYPWGKYDQIFVPEYNLGAMENPGCVTFTEQYLFREAATRSQYAGRCNTLLHEMSHMWFGDLVTPRWWDDLWLKESFAEFMGTHASIAIDAFAEAWVGFAGRRKAWAYSQDQLPTTHPIVADIPDVEAARQNFDGITYAKGASVLKQLVHYVGLQPFFAGARSYFAAHAYGSTSLADLLVELERSSGRDLGPWTKAWLETAGPDELAARVTTADDGTMAELRIEQTSLDAISGQRVHRPHVIAVGLYDLVESHAGGEPRLVRRGAPIEVELAGEGAVVEAASGQLLPALVLVNDGDWTYAKVRLDERSARAAVDHVGHVDDPLARALLWSQLWSMTRDGDLLVRDYLRAVTTHAAAEDDAATLGSLLSQAQSAIESFEHPDRVPPARREWVSAVRSLLGSDAISDDQRLLLARAFAVAAATVADPEVVDDVRDLLSVPQVVVPALEVGQDLRWSLVSALVATGSETTGVAEEELVRDNSMDGRTRLRQVLASSPEADPRALVDGLLTPGALSNDHVDAVIAGLRTPLREEATDGAVGDLFARATAIWADHSIEIAQRLVRGLFPTARPAETADRGRAWLAGEGAEAPAALRRIVLEQVDFCERRARVQSANA
ncbi:aminopeptidase N [Aestuariimicrobium sp. T2.26MG-19.2B]|uniref:aminopeptidase N n=1 Tax=Aestuariimicrobium sp. T2.26MG-19.2B TaxID=3040679 RepID=UPI002477688A|nr:aminopeptidase N [Aestuariimicrobium sp. T2.26MG-19.2B]CAI9405704.1 Aminopeptidase N [Aestuariimicrobium sp. T2.26MG-19.2B]